MEFRSQRPRGGGSESNVPKRRDDRTVRPKRRIAEDDRSYRSARSDTHRSSITEGLSKEYPVDNRRMPS